MTSCAWAVSFATADISAMQIYEDVLVPRLFTPWARLLLDALEPQPGEAFLDVACGPGSVTRLAAIEVGPAGRVTGVDLSPAMLAIAKGKPVLPGAAPIDYNEAPADRLPVADADFDVAVCQQGLQFFPNPAAALAEMRRALRAVGRVAIAVWAEIAQAPAFAALEAAVREVAGDELADRYRGGPWRMPDANELRELLEHAGFEEVRVTRDALPLSFESAAQLGSTLAASGIAAEVNALPTQRREQLGQALERTVVVDDALHAEAVAHLAFARR
ncbi:MAG TPA: methyltransferase domain-containing protein [Gaiellaceae bacterium]|nr:methyltransferase domain-containing protein [Gaiellaceae bacterium]